MFERVFGVAQAGVNDAHIGMDYRHELSRFGFLLENGFEQ